MGASRVTSMLKNLEEKFLLTASGRNGTAYSSWLGRRAHCDLTKARKIKGFRKLQGRDGGILNI